MLRNLLLFACLFPGILTAQQYGFQQYSLAEGVAQSQVFALMEDHQGYLWLGTQGGGVNRWDGINFQRFSVGEGLGNGKVSCIFQDRQHRIWIGTQGGITQFDGRSFLSMDFPGSSAIALDITQLPNDDIFIGSTDGLWTIRNDSLVRIQDIANSIHALAVTGDSLWIGSTTGLKCWSQDSLVGIPAGLNPRKPIESLEVSPSGDLLAGGFGSNIYQLQNGQFKEISLPFPSPTLTTDFSWTTQGDLWVSSQDQGVAQWSSRDSSWVTFGVADGLPNRYVRCLLVDSWDNVWMGTSGSGLCRYTGLPFVYFDRKNGLPQQAVYSILEDRDCRIWLGNGLTVGYLEEEKFIDLRDSPGFRRSKSKSILEDQGGRIWIGTEGQGAALITDTGFVWFDRTNGLASNWVRSMAEGPDGSIWIGTASSGLSRITSSTDTSGAIIWSIQNSRIQSSGPEASINKILFDQLGQMWISTRNLGLFRGRSGIWTRFLENEPDGQDIRSMAIDDDGRIWLGTADAGVLKLEAQQDTVLTEWVRDELTSSVVYVLAFDEYGALWIGSEQGMDRATIDEAGTLIEVEHFDADQGFLGIETTQNASLMDREGRMWFGTVNGVGRWQAGLREKEIQPPRLVMEEARLFYSNLRNTVYDSLLTTWNEFSGNLILPYNRNHLSFDLLGIDHDRAQEVLYQWKLTGSEPEWSPASARRTATFSNLSPGDYEFQARAGFVEGVWSEPISVSFMIKPPIWQTWWFQTTVVLFALLVVAGIFRFRLNQVKTKAATERQRLEMERDLIELEQKALRLQMNPHFIFNALNSIQALIGKEDPTTSRYHLSKFSRLMRQVLENSRHGMVSLDQEIQVLEDYLSLEKFSRKNAFDYEITIADEVDPEEEMVPPMVLQPFLENAIIHGISHLVDRKGMITLSVFIEGRQLICEIKDNGVGRSKAAEIKSQQEATHKSMALQVTQERLERLAEQGTAPELTVEDLVFSDGSPAGTLVRIGIPIVD